jgi:hypothetical protein
VDAPLVPIVDAPLVPDEAVLEAVPQSQEHASQEAGALLHAAQVGAGHAAQVGRGQSVLGIVTAVEVQPPCPTAEILLYGPVPRLLTAATLTFVTVVV